MLNLLRWGGEIRSWEDLRLPPADAKAAGVKEAELTMAKQLIEGMTAHWSADDFRDSFHDEIMKLVDEKASAGETEHVEPVEKEVASGGADVIDLTELLKRSLRVSDDAEAPAKPAARKAAGKAAAKKPAPARGRKQAA